MGFSATARTVRRWLRPVRRWLRLGTFAWACAGAVVHAQAIDEYQLKGAFLFNFAKFVDWPAGTFKGLNDPITGCILGDSPFGRGFEQAVNGKVIESRRFVIRRASDVRQTAGCQILFVSASERKRLRAILDEIGGGGILTVGDTSGFAADGGVVNFALENGKVRIQINLDAAEHEGLRINARLLSMAEIVKSSK